MSNNCEWCENHLGKTHYASPDYRIKFCSKKCMIQRYKELGIPPEQKAPGCYSTISKIFFLVFFFGGVIFVARLNNNQNDIQTESNLINDSESNLVAAIDSGYAPVNTNESIPERPYIEGVGVSFREVDGKVLVDQIIVNSPINIQSDVAIGDILVAISPNDDGNWQEVDPVIIGKLGLEEVRNLLRGRAGESLGLRFIQSTSESMNDFHIVREKIYTDNLQYISQ